MGNVALTPWTREAAMDLILKRAWWPGVQLSGVCLSLALLASIVLGLF
jgi:hypothetical protein